MIPARAIVLIAGLALGCSGSQPPSGSATATLFGPESRLDSWKTSVVEGIHVHALQPNEPCVAASMNELLGTATRVIPERRLDMKQMNASLDALMESMLVTSSGPAHGGLDRTVLALRRAGGDGSAAESLIIDLPRLRSGETEGLFKAGDVKAVYSRPPLVPGARLERGWVRVLRTESGRTEYELFLVLRLLAADAPVQTMQVIARVGWPPADPR